VLFSCQLCYFKLTPYITYIYYNDLLKQWSFQLLFFLCTYRTYSLTLIPNERFIREVLLARGYSWCHCFPRGAFENIFRFCLESKYQNPGSLTIAVSCAAATPLNWDNIYVKKKWKYTYINSFLLYISYNKNFISTFKNIQTMFTIPENQSF